MTAGIGFFIGMIIVLLFFILTSLWGIKASLDELVEHFCDEGEDEE